MTTARHLPSPRGFSHLQSTPSPRFSLYLAFSIGKLQDNLDCLYQLPEALPKCGGKICKHTSVESQVNWRHESFESFIMSANRKGAGTMHFADVREGSPSQPMKSLSAASWVRGWPLRADMGWGAGREGICTFSPRQLCFCRMQREKASNCFVSCEAMHL